MEYTCDLIPNVQVLHVLYGRLSINLVFLSVKAPFNSKIMGYHVLVCFQ